MLNHVLLHQTVIGQEAIEQMAMAGEEPDVVIGCAGGGSNFAGIAFPFIGRGLRGGPKPRIVAVEPEAAPSMTKGVYRYDFGDTAQMTPLVKMHTLGHTFIPEPIHAGGLRYHGMSPLVSLLKEQGLIEAQAVHQRATFEAGVQFARTEGILPAPESAHAIRVAIDEALRAREEGRSKVILFNLSGHGHFDLSAYEQYLSGALEDFEYPAERVAEALKALDMLPGLIAGPAGPPGPVTGARGAPAIVRVVDVAAPTLDPGPAREGLAAGPLEARWLGRIAYRDAWALQHELVERRDRRGGPRPAAPARAPGRPHPRPPGRRGARPRLGGGAGGTRHRAHPGRARRRGDLSRAGPARGLPDPRPLAARAARAAAGPGARGRDGRDLCRVRRRGGPARRPPGLLVRPGGGRAAQDRRPRASGSSAA